MTAQQKAYARYMSTGETGYTVCYGDMHFGLGVDTFSELELAREAMRCNPKAYCIAQNEVIMVWRKADEQH